MKTLTLTLLVLATSMATLVSTGGAAEARHGWGGCNGGGWGRGYGGGWGRGYGNNGWGQSYGGWGRNFGNSGWGGGGYGDYPYWRHHRRHHHWW
jgi:hypothetical protein